MKQSEVICPFCKKSDATEYIWYSTSTTHYSCKNHIFNVLLRVNRQLIIGSTITIKKGNIESISIYYDAFDDDNLYILLKRTMYINLINGKSIKLPIDLKLTPENFHERIETYLMFS